MSLSTRCSDTLATNAGLTTDQRGAGFPRIQDGTVDIGAYETPPPNTPPTISSVTDPMICSGTPTDALAVTVGDQETSVGSLIMSGTSNDQTLVPDANIAFGGSDADRTVTITPTVDQIGTAMITLTVTDGDSLTAQTTFNLDVIDCNPPITLMSITRVNANPTNAAQVSWTVTFSGAAVGVTRAKPPLTRGIEVGMSLNLDRSSEIEASPSSRSGIYSIFNGCSFRFDQAFRAEEVRPNTSILHLKCFYRS